MIISEPTWNERASRPTAAPTGGARPSDESMSLQGNVQQDSECFEPGSQRTVPEGMQEVEIDVSIPQTIGIAPRPDNVKIAGVDVSCTSPISVLKAACGYLQVSQSGSKSKLWERILATLDKRAIEAERELAAVALDESHRKADSIQVAEPPTDPSIIAAHNLTHLPYQSWCPACVMSK